MTLDANRSETILSELKRRGTGQQIVDVEEEKIKVVIFTLRGEYYAFYGEDIKEILHYANIFYVPGSPEYIVGIINVRGDIESVININRFLGLPDSEISAKSRIAVATKGGVRSGILLDSIDDLLDVAVSSIKPALSTLGRAVGEFVAGEMMHRDKSVTLLDVGKIFAKIAS
jgi:purine-binding chemotaxis protein CheW